MIGLAGGSEGDNSEFTAVISCPSSLPVNRLTPDNKMKALTAASVNNNGRRGTKPEFVSHPQLSDN